MEFNLNHPIIFAIVAVIILFVTAQSVFFLVRAIKRGKEIGMEKAKIRRIIVSAGIFTIAPAVAIVVSVIALSKKLGIALPWLRLSVIGSLSYETVAAENTINSMKLENGAALNASQYITVALVMTISILVGIWLVPVLCKKMRTGMVSMKNKDAKWLDIFQNSMFIGMISAFVGFVFCDVSDVFTKGSTVGLIPVCIMFVSAIVMLICGTLMKITKARWINDYALPASLIIGMASAIPLTAWLG